MALSKRTRFEVFKRDGFTCQYCGRRPPEVVLEVDHIHPSSKKGSDDEINLLTSCFDCNCGKSDKKLGDVHPRPDADLKFLETQQEIAEATRYLNTQEELDKLRVKIRKRLETVWTDALTENLVPIDRQFDLWLAWNSPEEVEFAIRRAAGKFRSGALSSWNSEKEVENCVRYVSGILKSRAQEKSETTA
jgi:hypothetical protein